MVPATNNATFTEKVVSTGKVVVERVEPYVPQFAKKGIKFGGTHQAPI